MNAEFLCSCLVKLRPNIFINVTVVQTPVVHFSVPEPVIYCIYLNLVRIQVLNL